MTVSNRDLKGNLRMVDLKTGARLFRSEPFFPPPEGIGKIRCAKSKEKNKMLLYRLFQSLVLFFADKNLPFFSENTPFLLKLI